MKFLGSKKGDLDNSVWLSNSDLMAGLMIIFLFISIGFIREKAPEVVGSQDYVLNYLTFTDSKENEIDEKLEQEFSNEEKKEWQLEIIPNENLIRFNAPDVMFSQSNFKLNDRFKFIINSFFPRYVKVLSKFGTLISEIRIEGHTSSEWKDTTYDKAYIKNMVLSQERTISVLNESLNSLTKFNLSKKEIKWAFDKVSASGLSSRSIIKNSDGSENSVKSRRVEFRYVLNETEKIKFIKSKLKNNGKN
ncbi:OmpA family protein [Candidatus Levibacter sp. Uisw_134_01]|jgi:outer membrane protein OmpA-like peptidoglycan-associated protein|uniref:OmpA family protein n=1 Tax=Candidatus Levibacter sp. Uisw_134_01 TaxID=3230999 RepID=UPI001DB9BC61|nr:OmpA family protein [Alphaproteobacteria bacterium]